MSLAEKPRVRRTQAQRTAEMRQRLCEAVITVLCDVGYDRLSTPLVADRAKVSRGALTHHFPTKVDMLVAGFEHLLESWEAGRQAFLAGETKPISVEAYIRHLWYDVFSAPTYVAALELMLAARSDEVLKERIQAVMASWVSARDRVWQSVLGIEIDKRPLDHFLHLNLCTMRGMAVHATFNRDDKANDELLEAWISLVAKARGGTVEADGTLAPGRLRARA